MTSSNIINARLLDDWILVRVEPPANVTDSGLHLGRMADFTWTEFGEVLAIGNGVRDPKTGIRRPIDGVDVGDRIVFSHRPSREQADTEAIWGKGARLMRLGQIDGTVPPCTCAQLVENFHPTETFGPGEHHGDCPSYEVADPRCHDASCPCQNGVMWIDKGDGVKAHVHARSYLDQALDGTGEFSPVTAKEAAGALDGGGPA